MPKKIYTYAICLVASLMMTTVSGWADEPSVFYLPEELEASGKVCHTPQDTIEVIRLADAYVKESFWKKLKGFFTETNPDNGEKIFDIKAIAAPHYTTERELGIGVIATGIYRTDSKDTLTPKSSISIFGDITTTGSYMIGVRGINIFSFDKCRMDYSLYFSSLPQKFWGIGFNNGIDDLNKCDYISLQSKFQTTISFRISPKIYLGPTISYDYIKGSKMSEKALQLIEGMPINSSYWGLGATASFDSRDYASNPTSGFYVNATQKGFTDFKGKPFFSTTINCNYYQRVWDGAILAFDFYGEFKYGEVPWTMVSKLGDIYRMRGYYNGRYRDNSSMSIQMELRQRIYRRHSLAAWGGCGTIWGKKDKFSWENILPNYGIGYRFEFDNRTCLRLDYGFGKNGKGSFIFSINEAF